MKALVSSKHFFSSIRNKLILAFAAMTFFPLLILSFYISKEVETKTRNDFIMLTNKEITQVDTSLNIFIDAIKEETLGMAIQPLIRNVNGTVTSYLNRKGGSDGNIKMTPLTNGGLETEIFQSFLRFKETHPKISYIYLGVEENGGYIQWPDTTRKEGYDPRSRSWYKLAANNKGKAMVSDPYLLSTGEAVVVSIVTPVTNNSGSMAGVFGLDISLKGLTDIIKDIKIGETGYIILIDSTGNIY